MKYRKKPVVIEAVQYTGPESVPQGECLPESHPAIEWDSLDMTFRQFPFIKYGNNRIHVRPGDWIIQEVNGEFWPCKPDLFEKLYEPAE